MSDRPGAATVTYCNPPEADVTVELTREPFADLARLRVGAKRSGSTQRFVCSDEALQALGMPRRLPAGLPENCHGVLWGVPIVEE